MTVEKVVESKSATLPSSKQVLEVSNNLNNGWKRCEATIDSGACEHVCPNNVAPNVTIQQTAASKAGVHFCSADGGRMRNLGFQSWTAYTDAGTKTHQGPSC